MSRQGHVLLVSHHFYPSGAIGAKRLSELAQFLANEGYEVTVLCRLMRKKARHIELIDRVPDVRRISIWAPEPLFDRIFKRFPRLRSRSKSSKNTVPITAVVENQALGTEKTGLRRQYRELENLLDRQKLWAMLAMIVGVVLRIRWKFDVVISSGPPVSPHLAALAISRTHSAKWIMDFRDPWVGSRPVIPGDVTEWRLRFERAAQRRCLAGCERVVSTSTEISSMLHEKFAVECEKLFVVTNGYDWELAPQESVGRLDMLYAGSLYLNRNPFPLCMAVANLIKQPSVDPGKVRLVFAGHCDSFGGIDLRTWLRENRLDSVVDIVGRLSVDELKPLVEKSTVLVNFAQDQPLQIPGKTFESIGARRYLLVIAEDESATARLVRNANAGLVVSPAEEKELDSALRALYERFVEKKIAFVPDDQELSTYSRSAANVEFSKIVESCTS